ncbi:hypothetical protein SRHO_G00007450 [Serrasalmus rhombeus]
MIRSSDGDSLVVYQVLHDFLGHALSQGIMLSQTPRTSDKKTPQIWWDRKAAVLTTVSVSCVSTAYVYH